MRNQEFYFIWTKQLGDRFIFFSIHDLSKYYPQNKRTPLHWAASGGQTEITEYLLGLGVPVDEPDDVSLSFGLLKNML